MKWLCAFQEWDAYPTVFGPFETRDAASAFGQSRAKKLGISEYRWTYYELLDPMTEKLP